MAETVVRRPLLRVLEAIIGLADRLELLLRFRAAAVAIRMAFHGQPAVSGFQGPLVGRAVHLKQLVIIRLNHDRPDARREAAPALPQIDRGRTGGATWGLAIFSAGVPGESGADALLPPGRLGAPRPPGSGAPGFPAPRRGACRLLLL